MLFIITSNATSYLEMFTSMTLNNLEPQNRKFLVNFSRFRVATRISRVNCAEMAGDRPRQSAYVIFGIARRF